MKELVKILGGRFSSPLRRRSCLPDGMQNALQSGMPALGFTVPYAVANIVLAMLAVLMVVLLN